MSGRPRHARHGRTTKYYEVGSVGVALLDRGDDPLVGMSPFERKVAGDVLAGLVAWTDTTVWDGDGSTGFLPIDYIAPRLPWEERGEVLRTVLQSLLDRGLVHHEFDRARDRNFRYWVTPRGVEVAAAVGAKA